MSEKLFISAESLLNDSFKLAAKILDSGYQPTFIIAVWRGGAPIGIAVQEFLAVHGIETDNIAIRTSSYTPEIDRQKKEIRIHGLSYLVKNLEQHDRLLIVDDVFDTGRSIDAIIRELAARTRKNMPTEIKVAVPYYKPSRNVTSREPDFFIHETSAWLKYPHSLEGLSTAEIEKNRPKLFSIIKDCIPSTP